MRRRNLLATARTTSTLSAKFIITMAYSAGQMAEDRCREGCHALTSLVKHPVSTSLSSIGRRESPRRPGRRSSGEDQERRIRRSMRPLPRPRRLRCCQTDHWRGFYGDEAKSLVDLGRKEFFETPGLNLYRLPQSSTTPALADDDRSKAGIDRSASALLITSRTGLRGTNPPDRQTTRFSALLRSRCGDEETPPDRAGGAGSDRETPRTERPLRRSPRTYRRTCEEVEREGSV